MQIYRRYITNIAHKEVIVTRGSKEIYFSIRNGISRQVSRKEWEAEWLRWWKKNAKS